MPAGGENTASRNSSDRFPAPEGAPGSVQQGASVSRSHATDEWHLPE